MGIISSLLFNKKGTVKNITDGEIVGYGNISGVPIIKVQSDYVNTLLGASVPADVFRKITLMDEESGGETVTDVIVTGNKFWYSDLGFFGIVSAREPKMGIRSYKKDVLSYLDMKAASFEKSGFLTDLEIENLYTAMAMNGKTGPFARNSFMMHIRWYQQWCRMQTGKTARKIVSNPAAFEDCDPAMLGMLERSVGCNNNNLQSMVNQIMTNLGATDVDDIIDGTVAAGA